MTFFSGAKMMKTKLLFQVCFYQSHTKINITDVDYVILVPYFQYSLLLFYIYYTSL